MTDPLDIVICYAPKDGQRFVVQFERLLRASGRDVTLTRWELEPDAVLGERLPVAGLHGHSAVVVVLSYFSLSTRWMDGWDAATIAEVERHCPVIAVQIDADSPAPPALAEVPFESVPAHGTTEVVDHILALL
ncbi:MAG: Toll-Interleukin receptor [Pseudonocardiales bacterium]|nr:Toll-Interleukin receptor [Pseudonocardiales bacterium]